MKVEDWFGKVSTFRVVTAVDLTGYGFVVSGLPVYSFDSWGQQKDSSSH